MILSEKETAAIKDLQTQEQTCMEKYARSSKQANEAKSVPVEWINDAGNDIRQPLMDYLAPLIQGEADITYQNGLPVYMNVSHLAKHQ